MGRYCGSNNLPRDLRLDCFALRLRKSREHLGRFTWCEFRLPRAGAGHVGRHSTVGRSARTLGLFWHCRSHHRSVPVQWCISGDIPALIDVMGGFPRWPRNR